jgi:hypothetical protein
MKLNKHSEPEPAVGTDYSMEEAKEIGAFAEDALSFEDACDPEATDLISRSADKCKRS